MTQKLRSVQSMIVTAILAFGVGGSQLRAQTTAPFRVW
jgi:hypothetical protein